MSSFGLNTAADFLQKLRHEKADFIQSDCLDPRHALNAVMTAYHVCEWVFPQLATHPMFPHRKLDDFRDTLKEMVDSPIADAGRLTNGTKHFKQGSIRTGKHMGAFQRSAFQDNAFDVSYLWLEREDGRRQRAEDFIDELVQFWDGFFKDHGLAQYAEAVGRSGRQRCPCGRDLVEIDNRGENLTGCSKCNVWWPLNKPPVRLSEEDLLALRAHPHGEERQKGTEPPKPIVDYEC
jgi:hypothetical protein